MGDLVLNIGPVSVTVVLFICATFLLSDGNPQGSKLIPRWDVLMEEVRRRCWPVLQSHLDELHCGT